MVKKKISNPTVGKQINHHRESFKIKAIPEPIWLKSNSSESVTKNNNRNQN